ncbi:flagellar biosynthesis protein FlhF [Salinispirillum sp. LH 10-3-1]|uniref:Flagellar biosynthesis protein FlhF n=1 Tax=Salinispirillum sp. LH 10-3-1 TaxID=2952525 RepID=A0AB38YCL3_9GAMM
MKVRKFIARNMSEGLKLVAAELGDEAMILSNRKVAEGIEILAAVKAEDEGDDPIVAPQIEAAPKVPSAPVPAPSQPNALTRDSLRELIAPRAPGAAPKPRETMQDSIIRMSEQEGGGGLTRDALMQLLTKHKDPLEEKRQKLRDQITEQNKYDFDDEPVKDEPVKPVAKPVRAAKPVEKPAAQQTRKPAPQVPVRPVASAEQKELSAMREELTALRQWLEVHERQNIGEAGGPLAQRLMLCGFDSRCITPMVEKYGDQLADDSWTLALEKIASLAENNAECLVKRGGIAALIGPTGAGKTTTLSKIATRFAMQHGADALGIISLDQYRIGAHEPVKILARILGCEIILQDQADNLEESLAKLSSKKLILIDTNGSERGLGAYQAQLGQSALERHIKPILVLPSNLSVHSLQNAYTRFSVLKPRGIILTKSDESAEIGPVLSLSLRKKVPLLYWSDGTLVPQDLHFGQVKRLIEESYASLKRDFSGAKVALTG